MLGVSHDRLCVVSKVIKINELVEEDDLPLHSLPADGALCHLVCTQLTGPVATQEHTVLASVHAHLTLRLGVGHKQYSMTRGRV